jgi:hypothetical protein
VRIRRRFADLDREKTNRSEVKNCTPFSTLTSPITVFSFDYCSQHYSSMLYLPNLLFTVPTPPTLRTMADSSMSVLSEQTAPTPPSTSVPVVAGSSHLGGTFQKQSSKTTIWKHFVGLCADPEKVQCVHCQAFFVYKDGCTSTITRHFRDAHYQLHKVESEAIADKKRKAQALEEANGVGNFFTSGVTIYPKRVLKWFCRTFQPLRSVENLEFREMQDSLNTRAPKIGNQGMKDMIRAKYSEVKIVMHEMLEGQYVALTSDAWTSIAH